MFTSTAPLKIRTSTDNLRSKSHSARSSFVYPKPSISVSFSYIYHYYVPVYNTKTFTCDSKGAVWSVQILASSAIVLRELNTFMTLQQEKKMLIKYFLTRTDWKILFKTK